MNEITEYKTAVKEDAIYRTLEKVKNILRGIGAGQPEGLLNLSPNIKPKKERKTPDTEKIKKN